MQESLNIFDQVRVRYLAIAWLAMLFYLPGADLLVEGVLANAPWYWWDVSFALYGQFLLTAILGLTVLFPVRVPLNRVIGRRPTVSEMRAGLIFTVFLFFVSWAAVYLIFLPLSYWFPDFVTYWLIELPDMVYFDFGEYPAAPNLVNVVSICVVAPIVEEFAFRGIILHRWAQKFGIRSAVFWSSLLFGIVHPDFLGAFAFGAGMCFLYLRTQSLMLPILCHSLYNFAIWLLEVGYIVKDGPEYDYTLEQFQSEWLFGLLSALIVFIWAWAYFRKPKPETVWKLPAL